MFNIRWWVSLCLSALLVGCSATGTTAFEDPREVVAAELGEQMIALQQKDLTEGDRIVLLRTAENPLITASLFVRASSNRWRLGGSINRAPLVDQGPISFRRLNQGQVTDGNELRAKYHVIFGEVSDPSITWVEITLHEGDRSPQRVSVTNGTWMVIIPAGIGVEWIPFDLQAGGPGRDTYQATNLKL